MDWYPPWALYAWGGLFLGVLVLELVSLWWNNSKRAEPGQRANLTAFVQAFFGIGERRLKYSMPRWIMVAFLAWLVIHFLDIAL